MADSINSPKLTDNQLGKELSRFQQRIPITWWALLFASILGFILVVFLLNNQVYNTGLLHGQAAALRVFSQMVWIPIAFFILILISLIGLIVYPRRTVIIREYGFELKQPGRNRALTWEEITGILVDFRWVWILFFPVKRQQITLQVYNKESFHFDEHLHDLDGFKDMVEKQIYPLIHKRMITGLEVNAVLHFGNVQIYPESGIKFCGKAIQWEKISSLDVSEGFLKMKYYVDGQTKEILKVRVAEVPNVPVLLQVTNGILTRVRDTS